MEDVAACVSYATSVVEHPAVCAVWGGIHTHASQRIRCSGNHSQIPFFDVLHMFSQRCAKGVPATTSLHAPVTCGTDVMPESLESRAMVARYRCGRDEFTGKQEKAPRMFCCRAATSSSASNDRVVLRVSERPSEGRMPARRCLVRLTCVSRTGDWCRNGTNVAYT